MPGAMIRRAARAALPFVVAGAAALGLALETAHAANASVLTVTNSGAGSVVSCGTGCYQVTIGQVGTHYLSGSCGLYTTSASFTLNRPDRITSATLTQVTYDDYQRVLVNGAIVWNAQASWTGGAALCGENSARGTYYPNTDLTGAFRSTGAGGSLVVRQDTSYTDKGEGYAIVTVRFDVAPCDDGIDNDGDGQIDYPADTGCTSVNDTTETYDTVPGTPCPGCSCGVDLNGNGDVTDAGEVQNCQQLSDGTAQCPLQRTSCVARDGGYVCPTNAALACQNTGGSVPTCSPNQCYSSTSGVVDSTDINQPEPTNDGPRGADGTCLGTLRVFAGQGSRCRKSGTQTAFQNCCDNKMARLSDTMGEKGGKTQRDYKKEASDIQFWSNQCDIQDQKTALLADSDYCIYLGEYCAEKWVFGCVQKAKSYCCFNSKLAKMIQEQGRAQIPSMGGFGSEKNPDCKGFTLEQFQALDFTKIDLSGYYADFKTQSQTMIQQNAQDNAHANTGR